MYRTSVFWRHQFVHQFRISARSFQNVTPSSAVCNETMRIHQKGWFPPLRSPHEQSRNITVTALFATALVSASAQVPAETSSCAPLRPRKTAKIECELDPHDVWAPQNAGRAYLPPPQECPSGTGRALLSPAGAPVRIQ